MGIVESENANNDSEAANLGLQLFCVSTGA